MNSPQQERPRLAKPARTRGGTESQPAIAAEAGPTDRRGGGAKAGATGDATDESAQPAAVAVSAEAAGGADAAGGAELAPFQSIGFAVSSIGYAVSRRFKELLGPLQLDPREFSLLRGVADAEGTSQQAIARRLQIPPSRMVAFVDALEERDLIERRAYPRDRRAWALHMTERGRKLLETAVLEATAFEEQLCAGLDRSQREQLREMLRRVGESAGVKDGIHAAHGEVCDQADACPAEQQI